MLFNHFIYNFIYIREIIYINNVQFIKKNHIATPVNTLKQMIKNHPLKSVHISHI